MNILPPNPAPQSGNLSDPVGTTPSTPESKASGPIGPYWDGLRKLKRVTVGGSLTSGLVVSQKPATASPMSPSPKLVEQDRNRNPQAVSQETSANSTKSSDSPTPEEQARLLALPQDEMFRALVQDNPVLSTQPIPRAVPRA